MMTAAEESLYFYYYLGRAITAWANVERQLCYLITTCFTKHNSNAAVMAFFSVDNFRSKLQMTDTLFTTKFYGSAHVKKWEEIHSTIERLATVRNHLAHYHTIGYLGKPGRRLALVPVLSRGTKLKQRVPTPPPGSLCIRDIAYAQLQFDAAAYALEFLAYRVTKHKTQLPASLAQVGDVPTLEQLTRQTRTLFSKLH
jgi:hypothetical protein